MGVHEGAYNTRSSREVQLHEVVAVTAFWADDVATLLRRVIPEIGRGLGAEAVGFASLDRRVTTIESWSAQGVERPDAESLVTMAADVGNSDRYVDVVSVHLATRDEVLVIARPGRPFDDHELEAIRLVAAALEHAIERLEVVGRSPQRSKLAELKEDFVAEVSHELRTPLTAIIGSLQTLMRPELAPTDRNAVALLWAAEEQARRLQRLVEDLLVASQIDGVGVPVRRRLTRPDHVVAATVHAIPDIDDRVTVTGTTESVLVDGDHLRRIVTNLVDNAIRHAPGASVEISLSVSDGALELVVADDGPGLAPEQRGHPFDGGAAGPQAGLGLGLRICRGLVEAMDGSITYEDADGARFVVRIPIEAVSDRAA